MKLEAIKVFRDRFTNKMYGVGDQLDFEDERARDVISRRLAKAIEAEGNTPVTDIDLSEQHLKVVYQVKAFTDTNKLKGYLILEKGREKPRESVVTAIEARIVELEGV